MMDKETARELFAKTRPIFVEKHDISAKLFKNKDAEEPCFSLTAKGDHRFDLYKIFTGTLLFLLWVASMRLAFGFRRARRLRMKEKKRLAKELKRH